MSSSHSTSGRPTVVFDIGAVLLEWNPRHLYRKLFTDEAAMEAFLAEVCTHDWNLSMDGGTPFAEAIAAKVAEFPHHEPLIRAFDERWEEMVPHVIEGTVEILKGLKERGDKVYAITNFSAEKFALALTKWPFLGWFDGVIVSAHEKLLKPDARIYRLLETRFGLTLADCIFIDDNPDNVVGARAVGMRAIRFESPEQARWELTEMGAL
ncbi:HAD family hydrolase [Inquilinus sp. OTU3971]|uniref:HAD family hydrolase n=1 Tax=Inquilinus sp. OTU3971 TaxID=3043855 RepID=UPI00313B0481